MAHAIFRAFLFPLISRNFARSGYEFLITQSHWSRPTMTNRSASWLNHRRVPGAGRSAISLPTDVGDVKFKCKRRFIGKVSLWVSKHTSLRSCEAFEFLFFSPMNLSSPISFLMQNSSIHKGFSPKLIAVSSTLNFFSLLSREFVNFPRFFHAQIKLEIRSDWNCFTFNHFWLFALALLTF